MEATPPGPEQTKGLQRRTAGLAGFTGGGLYPMINAYQASPDAPLNPIPPARPNPSSKRRKMQQRAIAREAEMELPEVEITDIGFGLFTDDDIDRYGVVNITDPGANGPNTVRDLRMGPHNNNELCETCGKDIDGCTGHMGKIVIPPLINPLLKTKLILVLSCICNTCSKLLATRKELEDAKILHLTGNNRLTEIKNLVKGRQCKHRAEPEEGALPCKFMPTYVTKRENKDDYFLTYTLDGVGSFEQSPEDIKVILHNISEEDIELMGFYPENNPESIILTLFPVLQYNSRPDAFQGDKFFYDKLTNKYREIVKKARDYFESKVDYERKKDLQSIYSMIGFVMRGDGPYTQGSNQKAQSILERVQGKTGVIRGNSMGKRVNFAGRTVIAPGAFLRADEVGIPRLMAIHLTRPFTVVGFNRLELQAKLDANEVTYITPSGGPEAGNRLPREHYRRKYPESRLQLGDVVERMLQDGDLVIINRAPTLHRQNMLAVKARIIDDRVMRIPLSLTTPQNADFDGDEMNVHVPQTVEAYIEAELLLAVFQNIMDTRTNKPIMGVVYDALSSIYQMTRPASALETIPGEINKIRTEMNKHAEGSKEYQTLARQLDRKIEELEYNRQQLMLDPVVFNLAIQSVTNKPQFFTLAERLARYGVPYGSGRSLASAIFPEGFDYNQNGVTIKDGIITAGSLNKGNIGPGGNILTEMIWQLGARVVVDFMSDASFVGRDYLTQTGFTIGPDDCLPPGAHIQQMLDEAIEGAKLKVLTMGQPINKIMADHQERLTMEALDFGKALGEKIIQDEIRPTNSLVVMSQSGSKGNAYNTVQLMVALGQQKVSNQRIQPTLPGGRTLPVFEPGDRRPEALGFCATSYRKGLSPSEFFFHAQGGREGLTDTANNTAETGALQHRLTKSAEDVVIDSQGGVRAPGGIIVQFVYGDDGFDSGRLGEVKMGNETIPFYRNLNMLADKINRKHTPLSLTSQ